MASHLFELCRSVYVNARRESGSPVPIVFKLCEDQYAAECGDFIMESVSGCCKWAIKYEAVYAWKKKREADLLDVVSQ